jgi:phosphatidylserine/phosphatidylglycerophosphate/cardiolipin synthase-like enzyme
LPRIPDGIRPRPIQPVSETAAPTPNGPAAPDRFEGATANRPVFEAYFTPYDPAQKNELALIDEVLTNRRADPTNYPPGENPHKIHYAVYNLRSPKIIEKLIEASKMGVDVKVLVEGSQIAPDRPWNTADDKFAEAGLKVLWDHREASPEHKAAAHMVGVQSNHLMHLKARIFSSKDRDTGELTQAVLSGSMNPGDGASRNDENLNLITDKRLIARYEQKHADVLAGRRSTNVWDAEAPINVLFTPVKKGPRAIEKVFELIEAEREQILLNVFDLKDVKDPTTRQGLVDRLVAAKKRGVDVVVVTDRKKSDGRDADGNRVEMYGHFASNYWVDEDLEKAGIPVYEFVSEAGKFNAVHGKAAIFGRTNIKVVTGAGNWTRASIGSGGKRARNEESFIFVDSKKLDNNRTGRRYLSNFLYLLRHYDHQNTEHDPAAKMIAGLSARPGWPMVSLDPAELLPPGFEGDAKLVGSHPALAGGLSVSNRGDLLDARTRRPIELPFGAQITYDVVDAENQVIGDDLRFVVRAAGDAPFRVDGSTP